MVIDMLGLVFGKWTVIARAETKNKRAFWLCRCECGTERDVNGKDLRQGKSASCGCSMSNVLAKRAKHRMVGTPTYKTWSSMVERCTNPNNRVYKYYGGKGITVCDRWRTSFVAFLEDMGQRPSLAYSLDRIDSDGNYEPSNCRWANRSTQRINSTSGPKSSSGIRGVNWTKQTNRWHAHIGINNKRINLGYYINKEDAVRARKEAELKYWGKSS